MEIQVNYIGPSGGNSLPSKNKVEVAEDTKLSDLLAKLNVLHNGAFDSLALDSAGQIINQIKILLNGHDMEDHQGLDTPLTSVSEVTIIYLIPLAGG